MSKVFEDIDPIEDILERYKNNEIFVDGIIKKDPKLFLYLKNLDIDFLSSQNIIEKLSNIKQKYYDREPIEILIERGIIYNFYEVIKINPHIINIENKYNLTINNKDRYKKFDIDKNILFDIVKYHNNNNNNNKYNIVYDKIYDFIYENFSDINVKCRDSKGNYLIYLY